LFNDDDDEKDNNGFGGIPARLATKEAADRPI
jgi:hypothetical protein